ncbi:MAG TPA: hypothetical protein VEY91_02025 [Candidatus Limnocylindria bacterium]|nr:hypothetical protein [Candidatus Limnocylindria bacterium]
MKRITMVLLVAVLTTFAASIASAGTWTPRIDRREARQSARIHQGSKCGQLTRGERVRLRAGQRHIHRMEARAKLDGRVTARERHRIARAQNHESRAIYRLKHNRRGRAV